MNISNPRFYVATITGRSAKFGIDLAAELSADNNYFFLSLAPGISREVAEKFHVLDEWNELNDMCIAQKPFVFRTLREVNAVTVQLFPRRKDSTNAAALYTATEY